MESQSWLSCFCSSQNWLLLLPFVIKKGRARISTKVHILWCTHWCLAIGWTQLDTMIHWLMSLAPTNEDSAWLAEVKTLMGKKITLLECKMTSCMCS